jgi:hypothetical protein
VDGVDIRTSGESTGYRTAMSLKMETAALPI